MARVGTAALAEAVRNLHGCEVAFVKRERVKENFQGRLVWEREVTRFELHDHPTAKEAFAWTEPGSGTKMRFFAVLRVPPIDGPIDAVRASIAADAKASQDRH